MVPLYTADPPADRDALYAELGGHLMWARLQEVSRTLERKGVGLSLVDHDRLGVEVVTQYMQIKARQAL